MKQDDDVDDLFGGLDDPKPKSEASRISKSDFMSDLFGGSKTGSEFGKAKEFVLDEKYKKLGPENSELPKKSSPTRDHLELPVASAGRGRRRGTPTVGGSANPGSLNLGLDPVVPKPELSLPLPVNPVPAAQTNLANPASNPIIPAFNPVSPGIAHLHPVGLPPVQPAPSYIQPQVQPISYQTTPTLAFSNPVLDQSLSLHNDLMRQMTEFERQQQEQFQRDLEEQRGLLEGKQREYRVSTTLYQ